MRVLILAGGRGTRLQSIVSDRPKPLAPIADKPFLAYQFDYLIAQDIKEVIVSVGFMGDHIRHAFGKKYNQLSIQYLTEEAPLGTGGAIHYALQTVGLSDDWLILNGDTFFPVNLNDFLIFHKKHQSHISLALTHVENRERYGSMMQNQNKIISFSEKSCAEPGWINGGMYLIHPSYRCVLNKISTASFSFEKEILMNSETLGLSLTGFQSDAPFIDIGTPESFQISQTYLAKHHIESKDAKKHNH